VGLYVAAAADANDFQARIGVLHSEAQRDVRFVVAHAHVVARLVMFDEGVFEKERLLLIGGDDALHIRRQAANELHAEPRVARAGKIVSHAVAQVRCLADIDDGPLAVLH